MWSGHLRKPDKTIGPQGVRIRKVSLYFSGRRDVGGLFLWMLLKKRDTSNVHEKNKDKESKQLSGLLHAHRLNLDIKKTYQSSWCECLQDSSTDGIIYLLSNELKYIYLQKLKAFDYS